MSFHAILLQVFRPFGPAVVKTSCPYSEVDKAVPTEIRVAQWRCKHAGVDVPRVRTLMKGHGRIAGVQMGGERMESSFKSDFSALLSCSWDKQTDAHIYHIFLHVHVNKWEWENICPVAYVHTGTTHTIIRAVANLSGDLASISRLSVPHPLVLPRFTSSIEMERRWTGERGSEKEKNKAFFFSPGFSQRNQTNPEKTNHQNGLRCHAETICCY